MAPNATTALADRYEIATIALHPLGDSYAAVAEEFDGNICATEMAMESHYKKDLKGHFVGQGLAGKYRNTGEHEISKEDVLRWLRTNLAPQFLDEHGVPPPVETQSLAAAANTERAVKAWEHSAHVTSNLLRWCRALTNIQCRCGKHCQQPASPAQIIENLAQIKCQVGFAPVRSNY